MAETVCDHVVAILAEWGVDTVFGLPGDGINGFVESLRRARDRIRFIHCGTRKPLHWLLAAMPSSPAGSVSCSRPRHPGRSICSTVSTMRRSTARRCWRSPG